MNGDVLDSCGVVVLCFLSTDSLNLLKETCMDVFMQEMYNILLSFLIN